MINLLGLYVTFATICRPLMTAHGGGFFFRGEFARKSIAARRGFTCHPEGRSVAKESPAAI